VAAMARWYYSLPGNGVGGSLHIALEDRNLRDGDLLTCSYWAMQSGDAPGVVLAARLLAMTLTQRRRVFYLTHWRPY
jgi:hypothetical protein